jgi:hypothetical protein
MQHRHCEKGFPISERFEPELREEKKSGGYLCIIIIMENRVSEGFPSLSATELLKSYKFLPYKSSHANFLKRTNPVSWPPKNYCKMLSP